MLVCTPVRNSSVVTVWVWNRPHGRGRRRLGLDDDQALAHLRDEALGGLGDRVVGRDVGGEVAVGEHLRDLADEVDLAPDDQGVLALDDGAVRVGVDEVADVGEVDVVRALGSLEHRDDAPGELAQVDLRRVGPDSGQSLVGRRTRSGQLVLVDRRGRRHGSLGLQRSADRRVLVEDLDHLGGRRGRAHLLDRRVRYVGTGDEQHDDGHGENRQNLGADAKPAQHVDLFSLNRLGRRTDDARRPCPRARVTADMSSAAGQQTISPDVSLS
jgi:hypothetical protein